MRERFHADLHALGERLSDLFGAVAAALEVATHALLAADLVVAQRVIAGDADINARRADCERHAYRLVALQAPVAGELRAVLAVLHGAERAERTGDLARHIAETARRRHPGCAVPTELRTAFATMSHDGVAAARTLQRVILAAEPAHTASLHRRDEHVDQAHARVLARLTEPSWPHGVEIAVDAALLARFYERYADHAVTSARHLDYARTGTCPTSTATPRPAAAASSGETPE